MSPDQPDNGHTASAQIENSRPFHPPADQTGNVTGGFNQKQSSSDGPDEREEWLRDAAYFLWEQAGSPEGQESHYWTLAGEQYDRRIDADRKLQQEPPKRSPESEDR